MKRTIKLFLAITLFAAISCGNNSLDLPRGRAPQYLKDSVAGYLASLDTSLVDLHSIMLVQHGKVLYEQWFSEGAPDKPHTLWSVSKTFTSIAVGLAIDEGYFGLQDKIVDIFPDKVPEDADPRLADITVESLLMMGCGHAKDPTGALQKSGESDWVAQFMAYPIEYGPCEMFCYNSAGTYMLSAIVQKTTGEKVFDYLTPRLFGPLGITDAYWDEIDGVNAGGWGLHLKTEDLAKTGTVLLNGGKWRGSQLIPEEWVKTMSSKHIDCVPAGLTLATLPEGVRSPKNEDWFQGYCYQMWRCTHNAFRADGAYGQYIVVMPEQDAVLALTANARDLQQELAKVWDHIFPALEQNK